MSEKMFASLSSGLLARKGAAKPAMRPQGFGQMGASLEDLGWNDMGHDAAPAPPAAPGGGPDADSLHRRSHTAALTPATGSAQVTELRPTQPGAEALRPEPVEAAPAPEKAVLKAPPVAVRTPAAVGPARTAKPRSEPGANGRAAFTLRLDPARHLRLRLACAVTGRSAQGLVTDALDQYLQTIPELEGLAGQVPDESRAHSRKG